MDVNNFGAFAIVLQKPIANSLKKAYEAIVKRYESENKQTRYICLKNNEVIYMHRLSRERKQLILLLKSISIINCIFLCKNIRITITR